MMAGKQLICDSAILARDSLKWSNHDLAGYALSVIAETQPDFMRSSTVKALESILTRKGLESDALIQSNIEYPLLDIVSDNVVFGIDARIRTLDTRCWRPLL